MKYTGIVKGVYFILVLTGVLSGCDSTKKEDVLGLWKLDEVNIDGYDKTVYPTFIELKENNSFAASRVAGDVAGVYWLQDNAIMFISEDNDWFGTKWTVRKFADHLQFKGLEPGYRVTTLKFIKIDSIPKFEAFEAQVLGRWELYKIRKGEEIQRLSNTWLTIDEDGTYSIANSSGLVENGRVIVNTRHRKVIFENEDMIWNAWFYGEELRLDNKERQVQYSLRK